jgi:hypothetical protein
MAQLSAAVTVSVMLFQATNFNKTLCNSWICTMSWPQSWAVTCSITST